MIFVCFPFFDELDILEVRLNELWDVADAFVLVEGTRAFAGDPKPLYYAQSRRRFQKFWPKLHSLVVPDMPAACDSWARERHQRNFIGYGLLGCDADDIIVITDGDEIVRAEALTGLEVRHGEIVQLVLDHFYYYWNLRALGDTSSISKVMTYRTLIEHGGPEIAARTVHRYVPDGGWHFAYAGGVEGIRRKLGAFSHQDLNRPPYNTPEYLREAIETRRDLYGRDNPLLPVPVDERFPAYVRANQERFKHHFCEGTP